STHSRPLTYPNPAMMFSKSFMTPLFALMSFLTLVMAMPLQKRDVYVPPILEPNAQMVWTVGQYYNVTWNTTNPPAQITNSVGQIYLVVNGLIDFNYTLAANFSILLGSVQVQAPN
ncbi:symbiosis-related protein, partial [Scleroderma citrinum]